MTRIGNVKLMIERESDGVDMEVTSYPVEQGLPITDHVKRNPETTSLTGFILGSSADRDYEALKKLSEKGTLVTYTGRKVAKNVIIKSINRENGEFTNGSSITIDLQEIRIAKTPFVKKQVKSKGKKKKSGTKKSAAVYRKIKAGETYSHMRMWYGTSLAQLRSWNKYPDRRIPIGANLRVK